MPWVIWYSSSSRANATSPSRTLTSSISAARPVPRTGCRYRLRCRMRSVPRFRIALRHGVDVDRTGIERVTPRSPAGARCRSRAATTPRRGRARLRLPGPGPDQRSSRNLRLDPPAVKSARSAGGSDSTVALAERRTMSMIGATAGVARLTGWQVDDCDDQGGCRCNTASHNRPRCRDWPRPRSATRGEQALTRAAPSSGISGPGPAAWSSRANQALAPVVVQSSRRPRCFGPSLSFMVSVSCTARKAVAKCLPGPGEDRLGGLRARPETGCDLPHRKALDVLPLQRVAVANRQVVEHRPHHPGQLLDVRSDRPVLLAVHRGSRGPLSRAGSPRSARSRAPVVPAASNTRRSHSGRTSTSR